MRNEETWKSRGNTEKNIANNITFFIIDYETRDYQIIASFRDQTVN